MKYKKYSYILVLILMLLVGINGVHAASSKTCYYVSNNNEAMAQLTIKFGYKVPWMHGGKAYSEARFQNLGGKLDDDTERIINWYSNHKDKVTGINLNKIYKNSSEANENPTCPTYLIMRSNKKYSSYGAFATNSITEAKKFVEASKKQNYNAWYLSHTKKDSSGNINEITENEYWNAFGGFIEGTLGVDFNTVIDCTDLFGDPKDEDSLAYMINKILEYVRIIVPILIITLGVFDLGKAVIASKEDEMRRAQITFIKRILIGVVIFFAPLVVNIVMELADIVWEGMGYTICKLK